jgi:predicted deacylase
MLHDGAVNGVQHSLGASASGPTEPGPPVWRLPLTYDECRARFRRIAATRGMAVEAHPIDARGPQGQELTVDVVRVGAAAPARLLVLLSGVHGVEGFIGSTLQTDLLDRIDADALPSDTGVLVVHAVNPWGMAWWRRQNESNVDLNRNWRRDHNEPIHNDAYDELHPIACPDTDDLPSVEHLLEQANELVAARGLVWVRDAITVGQYRHADGLHYGGARTEASTAIVERVVAPYAAAARFVLTIDLHTGHGLSGEITFLSDQPVDSAQDVFFHTAFPTFRIEATADNPDATTGTKSGQIANGLAQLFPDATCFASSVELGTASDLEQLAATYQEQWVHRHGDRNEPEHAAAVWAYRCCFTPDDPAWEQVAFARGRTVLDQAVHAIAHPPTGSNAT